MTKYFFSLLFLLPHLLNGFTYTNLNKFDDGTVESIQQIKIKGYETAFNPTMVAYKNNILMAFRLSPEPNKVWINYIALVLVDWNFNPISEVQILNLRAKNSEIPSRVEDPRLVTNNGRIYLIYNDGIQTAKDEFCFRREIFIVEILQNKSGFYCGEPILLKHPTNYPRTPMEKNWTPFSFDDELVLSYTLNPHEVLYPDLETGKCDHLFTTQFPSFHTDFATHRFEWGNLRGGTTPILLEDCYLCFFHTAQKMFSSASRIRKGIHYFMGAYTFSKTPPFEILSVSPYPLYKIGMYEQCTSPKKITYPGGFLIKDEKIYVIYGKDDRQIWLATFDKETLLDSLKPVKTDFMGN